jgi:hypothetical protein
MVMSLRSKWAVFNATLRAAASWLFFRPATAHARQHKGRVQCLRPEGAKEFSPAHAGELSPSRFPVEDSSVA